MTVWKAKQRHCVDGAARMHDAGLVLSYFMGAHRFMHWMAVCWLFVAARMRRMMAGCGVWTIIKPAGRPAPAAVYQQNAR